MAKVAEWFEKTKTFLNEVKGEMKKVTWPTKEQIKSYTVVVVITSCVLAVAITVVDRGVSWLLIQLPGLSG